MSRHITTARMVMCPAALADFEDRARCMSEPAVMRHFGGRPMDRHDVWVKLLAQIGHWDAFGYGYWTARTLDGRYVGNVGFSQLERGVVPDFGAAPELGYIVATWAQGQGYASEAVAAAHAWLQDRRGRERTVAMISPENTPSIRLATKFGYREFARSTFKSDPMALFEKLS